MITVKKHGVNILETKCDACGCEFFYTLADTKIEYAMNGLGCETHPVCRYVMCPECLAHPVAVYKFGNYIPVDPE